MWRALLVSACLALPAGTGAAQEGLPLGQVQSPILTIDADRLIEGSLYGQRIAEDLGRRTEALAAENERLAQELQAEERSLTERRPLMEVEAFRAEAEAFDQRVQRIRAEQDAKQAALEDAVEQGRQVFLNAVSPVLARLMVESGAAVILERREVFLSAGLIDVTDEAIAAVDEALGDGRELVEPGAAPEAPGPAPAPQPSEPAAPAE